MLRGIARYAGVHLYNEAGDVLYATPDLLSVHSISGGWRRFQLLKAVEVVYDLFNQREVAHHAREFEVVLDPASTNLFFTGSRQELVRL